MAFNIQSAQGEATTKVQTNKGKNAGPEMINTEKVGEPVKGNNIVTIGLSRGYTANLGNYTSTKFDVSITLPVDVDPEGDLQEQLDGAFAFAEEYVNSKMEKLGSEIESMKQE